MLIHSDERLFKCIHCPQTFKQKTGKFNHIRSVHGVNKAFKCDECTASFSRDVYLLRHKETAHCKRTLYNCSICFLVFKEEASLDAHFANQHFSQNMGYKIAKSDKVRNIPVKEEVSNQEFIKETKCTKEMMVNSRSNPRSCKERVSRACAKSPKKQLIVNETKEITDADLVGIIELRVRKYYKSLFE